MLTDEDGTPLVGSLMDYVIPKASQGADVQVHLVEVPSPDGPFGARGAAEPPVIPTAAAVANAVRQAVGVRVTDLPLTPERVFIELQKRA
jgi:CO/xanthine dehydrogenase Mo-binding subunit